MSNISLLKTLQAFRLGKPVQKGQMLSVPIFPAEQTCFVSFVRMGGESIPWGVAIKKSGKPIRFFSVPDPRKRTELAAVLREFSEFLRSEFNVAAASENVQLHPQVWLPNRTHLDMFHYLALRYLWTTFEAEEDYEGKLHAEQLRRLGRISNFLFNLAQIPSQTMLFLGTTALKSAYFFPSDSLRQSHLGFLLAWLETPGSREVRTAAAALAEKASISTSLDPKVEKEELEKWVEIYNSSQETEEARKSAKAKIEVVIQRELRRRIEVTERAHAVLKNDKRTMNPGLKDLIRDTLDRFVRGYLSVESSIAAGDTPYIAGAETDASPLSATMAYFDREEAQVLAESALLAHDPYLQAAAVTNGDAIHGVLVASKRTKVDRSQEIEWQIEASDSCPLRLREGAVMRVKGIEKSELVLDKIEVDPERDLRIFTFYVKAPKTAKNGVDMADPEFIGKEFFLMPVPFTGGKWGKQKALFREGKPGAWILDKLKHASKAKRKAA